MKITISRGTLLSVDVPKEVAVQNIYLVLLVLICSSGEQYCGSEEYGLIGDHNAKGLEWRSYWAVSHGVNLVQRVWSLKWARFECDKAVTTPMQHTWFYSSLNSLSFLKFLISHCNEPRSWQNCAQPRSFLSADLLQFFLPASYLWLLGLHMCSSGRRHCRHRTPTSWCTDAMWWIRSGCTCKKSPGGRQVCVNTNRGVVPVSCNLVECWKNVANHQHSSCALINNQSKIIINSLI